MTRTADLAIATAASDVQRLAAHPHKHAWVSANAGTGKTQVLTQRMVTLLLTDLTLQPRQILALTFTNAGAFEMRERLAKEMTAWGTQDDSAFAQTLTGVLGYTPTAAQLERARLLPSLLRDDPPLITTLHGFGQMVLARFPLEAGVSPNLTVLDTAATHTLLRSAMEEALLLDRPDTQEALDILLTSLGDQTFETLTQSLVQDWDKLMLAVAHHGGGEAMLAALRHELGLEVEHPFPPLATLQVLLPAWISALEHSGKSTDAKLAVQLQTFMARGEVEADDYLQAFGTQAGTLLSSFGTQAAQTALGDRWQEVLDLRSQLADAFTTHYARQRYDQTAALVRWVLTVKGCYDALKAQQGALDFADMIAKVHRLLDSAEGAWIAYRLDRTIRHLLVDEAQDNSPLQNSIVRLLADNLLASDETPPRTLFVVGDMKQSIYRFQGANPAQFVGLRAHMEAQRGTTALFTESLTTSFRTSPPVLALVDAVLEPHAAKVLGEPEALWPRHVSAFPAAYGQVEIWPLLQVEASEGWQGPGWRPIGPPDSPPKGPFVLAERLAAYLTGVMADGQPLACTGRPLTPGDVMVLTRDNKTARQMGARLRQLGFAVHLETTEAEPPTLAADAMAWLRVLANPHDTVSLLTLLKSPLCRWDDAALARLHLARDGAPTWLEAVGAVNPTTAAWLAACQDFMAAHTPHQTLAWLLERWALPLYAEGVAAASTLLDMALGVPSLTELVAKLERLPLQVPTAPGPQALRIMTVHKSKGLQAPLVIVVGTASDGRSKPLLWHDSAEGLPVNLAVKGDSKTLPQALKNWQEAEEHRGEADDLRSLYVALTRAQEQVLVCGWTSAKADNSWQAWVEAAVKAHPDDWHHQDGGWTMAAGMRPEVALPHTAAPPVEVPPYPALNLPALRTHTTSAALERGTVVHSLLQTLPALPAGQRAAQARLLLPALTPTWDASARDEVLAEVMTVLDSHAPLFARGAAEVPLALPEGLGRIDRLAEHEGCLWVLDFKTDTDVPAAPPAAYIRQVQGYMQALRREVARPLRGAILYTRTATLIPVDAPSEAP